MVEQVKIYKGKLGEETLIEVLDGYDLVKFNRLPQVNELIAIPADDPIDEYSSDVYIVKQVLTDYVANEFNLFVELYDWE